MKTKRRRLELEEWLKEMENLDQGKKNTELPRSCAVTK